MHPQLEAIFDQAENRYLQPDELGLIDQYVGSLPARIDAYRALRDRELEIMQQVADQLQIEMPQESVNNLERSIKNALLMLRACAMGMLLDDDTFVQTKLIDWLGKTITIYNTQSIDAILYRLLNERLSQALSPNQMSLLHAQITKAQSMLLQPTANLN